MWRHSLWLFSNPRIGLCLGGAVRPRCLGLHLDPSCPRALSHAIVVRVDAAPRLRYHQYRVGSPRRNRARRSAYRPRHLSKVPERANRPRTAEKNSWLLAPNFRPRRRGRLQDHSRVTSWKSRRPWHRSQGHLRTPMDRSTDRYRSGTTCFRGRRRLHVAHGASPGAHHRGSSHPHGSRQRPLRRGPAQNSSMQVRQILRYASPYAPDWP
jgi:hypothetical protein